MSTIKDEGKSLIHDITDMAKLTVDEVKQEFKQELTKQKIKNKMDDLHCTYENVKHDVKETIINKLDSL
ncbi:MAG: hypothetical protein ACRCTE_03995 [Cellulosilyticaceae bacterium]